MRLVSRINNVNGWTQIKMSKLSELKFKDSCGSLPGGFWSAVDVWIKKPHVVNKRLSGAKEEESKDCEDAEIEDTLSGFWNTDIKELNDVFCYLRNGVEGISQYRTGKREQWSFTTRSVIPKVSIDGTRYHKEFVVKDLFSMRVTFLPVAESVQGFMVLKKGNIYQIQLRPDNDEEWSISISTFSSENWDSDGVVYPKLSWLSSELLPKLVKWCTEKSKSEFKSTLSLIPVEKYSILYQQLKEKYKAMVKVWPEVTDPEKFVYEDVAIATYLLVLWEEERTEKGIMEKQSFVDLGCGNGLLVHILSNEGHPGRGIDVRKRKIWDMYGPQTHLEECAITPSDSFLFQEADWLIGNHSDELTPWIPVMAARSSYFCRYFVLPCCFFDFYGKYSRQHSEKSQYKEYIDFIAEVSRVCGFTVEEDCLRIPSTKRVCLIGKTRNYDCSQEALVDDQRTQYIKKRLACQAMANHGKSAGETTHLQATVDCLNVTTHMDDVAKEINHDTDKQVCATGNWAAGFQPREKIECVRNCAHLPRELIDKVVLQVANALLGLKTEDGQRCNNNTWNSGGSLTLRETAELLDKETLQNLKNECGGLQTLLKNNHQVFKVEGGRVGIRDWRMETGGRTSKRKTSSELLKTRLCWFHVNHPQGCPLPPESCAFAHGPEDLRRCSFQSKRQKNKQHQQQM
ncbi:probable tRNA (uracil-O(2)-)-methyltransferase [Lepisosteus oculatus]|uniref:tRNA (uracil-O(2)-)-methyltransferase n=1 Tax=Lepisosteus oculatus TaxID=7918 RepID=W5MW83_LEPOC|nr:PREDICTED: probable tRNA (uracil-O(2)-)-methyltransferase [Lepisosteus oculatus]